MSEIPITASAVSNYAGMDALVGEDGRVYLGRHENVCPGNPAYDHSRDAYRPRAGVSPPLMNAQHNSAQKFPAPKPRRKKHPPTGGRDRRYPVCTR